jgi:hypothetical protein
MSALFMNEDAMIQDLIDKWADFGLTRIELRFDSSTFYPVAYYERAINDAYVNLTASMAMVIQPLNCLID